MNYVQDSNLGNKIKAKVFMKVIFIYIKVNLINWN